MFLYSFFLFSPPDTGRKRGLVNCAPRILYQMFTVDQQVPTDRHPRGMHGRSSTAYCRSLVTVMGIIIIYCVRTTIHLPDSWMDGSLSKRRTLRFECLNLVKYDRMTFYGVLTDRYKYKDYCNDFGMRGLIEL